MTRTASVVTGVRLSAIKEMAMRAAARDDVVSLAWGLPSFRTPETIRNAVALKLEEDPDIGKYTLPDGLPRFREAAARRFEIETGIAVDPDLNVLATAGNMQGVDVLFHTLLEPDDEVIVTDPGFVSHIQQIRLCGGKPVFWPLLEEDGWKLDVEALKHLVSPRTRAIVLVSPSNPTGRIFDRDELLGAASIARQHDVPILLDDPYSRFRFDQPDAFFNLASAAGFRDTVIYLFTFSKVHAMSGWRLGYMVVPEALKREVLKVHDANIICPPRISQQAGIVALDSDQEHVEDFRRILSMRLEMICERLDRVPHVFRYQRPQGAYYVFPRIVADHGNAFDFAIDLLESAGVSVTPGAAFGPSGEHHVRLAFCVEEDVIHRAFDRIERRYGSG